MTSSSRATPPSRRKKSETFSTAADNQTSVEIHVLQGERADGRRQPHCSASSSLDGHPARAARRAADRGHVRHRRQRHRQRVGQGQGHGQGRSTSPSPRRPACQEADIQRMVKDAPGARGGGQEATGGDRAPQQARVADLPGPEAPRREPRQDRRGGPHRARGGAQGGQGDRGEQPRSQGGAAVRGGVRAAPEGVAQDGRGALPQRGGRGGWSGCAAGWR